MGTVHIASSDALATLPPDYTFTPGDGGRHDFTNGIVLRSAGRQSITVTDTSGGFSSAQVELQVLGGASQPVPISLGAVSVLGVALGVLGAWLLRMSDVGA